MPKTHFPRIIHRIWVGKPIPQELEDWWQTWVTLNPEWECRTWSEANLEPLIADLGLKGMYDWVTRANQKSDIGRLALLWKFGGCYVDADYQCLKPIESVVREWERAGHSLVMSEQLKRPAPRPPMIGAAIGWSVPRHPVVKWMLMEQLKRVSAESHTHTPHAIRTTGPGIWEAGATAFPDEVHVAPQWMFQPLEDQMDHVRVGMSRLPRGVPIPDNAYAVHHSSSLWGPQPWKDKTQP